MGTGDITMYGVSVLLFPLLSLTMASPVLQSGLEVQGTEASPEEKGLLLIGLAGWGLYSLFENLLGSTPPTSGVTTPAPAVTTPGFGVTTPGPEVTTPAPGVTTPTPETTTKKSGLFGWWPNNGGFLGFGLFGKTTETVATTTATTTTTTTPTPTTTTTPTTAPPTTTKCGGDSCFADSLMKSRDEVTKNIVKITLNSYISQYQD